MAHGMVELGRRRRRCWNDGNGQQVSKVACLFSSSSSSPPCILFWVQCLFANKSLRYLAQVWSWVLGCMRIAVSSTPRVQCASEWWVWVVGITRHEEVQRHEVEEWCVRFNCYRQWNLWGRVRRKSSSTRSSTVISHGLCVCLSHWLMRTKDDRVVV